jgi:hypothetical protein
VKLYPYAGGRRRTPEPDRPESGTTSRGAAHRSPWSLLNQMGDIYHQYWREGRGSVSLAKAYGLPHRFVQRIICLHDLSSTCGPRSDRWEKR